MSSSTSTIIVVPLALLTVSMPIPVAMAAAGVYGMVRAGRSIHDHLLTSQQQRAQAESTRHQRLCEQVRQLAKDCDELGLEPPVAVKAPTGSLWTIAEARQQADQLTEVNDAFEATVQLKHAEVSAEQRRRAITKARRMSEDHGRRADAERLSNPNRVTWFEARAKQVREQSEPIRRSRAAELAGLVEALPAGTILPSSLVAAIGAYGSDPGKLRTEYDELRLRLKQVEATALLRSQISQTLGQVKALAAAIWAYDFQQRAEMLALRAERLPSESDWDSRREVEQELAELIRDLADRQAETHALHARVVALAAVHEALRSQGLELSTSELGLWVPQDGHLEPQSVGTFAQSVPGPAVQSLGQEYGSAGSHCLPHGPDQVMIRVKGSRKAVLLSASNQPDQPDQVSFRTEQVWLGRPPTGADLGVAAAQHDQVCQAIEAAFALLPGFGIVVDPPAIDQTPDDPDLAVLDLTDDHEAILRGEEQPSPGATANRQISLQRQAELP